MCVLEYLNTCIQGVNRMYGYKGCIHRVYTYTHILYKAFPPHGFLMGCHP